MYLHIGNGKNVKKKKIIGIFDLDLSTESMVTRDFLQTAEKRKRTEYSDEDIPKSFVLIEDGVYDRILFSKLSSTVLRTRCENVEYGQEAEKEE